VPDERLQMLTGTDVTSMWLGKSEENIRKLFEPAEASYQLLGDKSPLFMIVFDEIDAMLPARDRMVGSNRSAQVNQFLGKLDGLKTLNNILVIGITNILALVDRAALRFDSDVISRFRCQIRDSA
jgi:vesicle-fusing ATPase